MRKILCSILVILCSTSSSHAMKKSILKIERLKFPTEFAELIKETNGIDSDFIRIVNLTDIKIKLQELVKRYKKLQQESDVEKIKFLNFIEKRSEIDFLEESKKIKNNLTLIALKEYRVLREIVALFREANNSLLEEHTSGHHSFSETHLNYIMKIIAVLLGDALIDDIVQEPDKATTTDAP